MRPLLRWTASVLFVAMLAAGCAGGNDGEGECSCAAGITYRGVFYSQESSEISVQADVAIGKSDQVDDCCGGEAGTTIYSIEGINSQIAIASKSDDGETRFNVASDLAESDQRLADQFAKKHHHDPAD